jgi:preprotein translocase subunit SecG
METFIWIIHTLAALAVIGLVLIQHGKGADVGAAFGSGSAGSLFGSAGARNFLSTSTAVLAAVFFVSSLGLTFYYGRSHQGSVLKSAPIETTKPAKAGETPPATAVPGSKPAPENPKGNEIPK